VRKHNFIALIWALLNVWLASRIPMPPRSGWALIVMIGFAPASFIFFADFIAKYLFIGFIERFARDVNEPQSPHAIMFFGWIMMAILTVLMVLRLV
jgi:hypothetical protein